MLTMPASRSSTSTGMCRTRFWVISSARSSTLDSGPQVATTVDMIEDTERFSMSGPSWCNVRIDVALRDDADDDGVPGVDDHHRADVAQARPASSSVTVASGPMVATSDPLARSTSTMRIGSLPCVTGITYQARDGSGAGGSQPTEQSARDDRNHPSGTGSPLPDPAAGGPATLIRAGGQNLLVDCGRGVLMRLAAAGVGAKRPDGPCC